MSKIFRKNEKGFTLVEILLISVVVVLVAVSITMLFSGGRRTWTSADKDSETIQNAVVGMEKLVRELKNSPGLTDIGDHIDDTDIRFAVSRTDGIRYARVKLDGKYLKYGERDKVEELDDDGSLSNLAYPVTYLKFEFKKLDGSKATPGTDDPASVRSVLISMTTSENGVEIPLTSRAFLSADTAVAYNFDGTQDNSNEPGKDKHHFNEGNDKSDSPPPPGSKGDGVKGWGLSDFVIFGDKEVNISNNCTINGNVGTRSKSGKAHKSENNNEINGYLIVKGNLDMTNGSQVNNETALAACVQSSNSEFANNCQINGHFWTLNNVTMKNSSWINGTVYMPPKPEADISLSHQAKYNKRVDINVNKAKFILDPEENNSILPGESVFPVLPKGISDNEFTGSNDIDLGGNDNMVLNPGQYRNLKISNSARLTMGSGTYYFNSILVRNSSRIRFNFNNGPIWIYVKDKVTLSNSASFEYLNGDADLLYLEPKKGMICENSVQWRGFIYASDENAVISFANGTTLRGAAYTKGIVNVGNHVTATYMPPKFDYINKTPILLSSLFYPQNK